MKNSNFKFVSMAFALCFAIVSTLAFSPAENSEDALASVTGYYWNPDQDHCQTTLIQCADVNGTTCIDTQERQLYKLEGTTCPNSLAKL